MVTMIVVMPMVKSGNSDDELRVVEKIMKCWHVGNNPEVIFLDK